MKKIKKLILCIDFEMICLERKKSINDIVEIGACIFDGKKVTSTFSSLCQPSIRHAINQATLDFLKIGKPDFDASPSFEDAILEMNNWIKPNLNNIEGWASWGSRDFAALKSTLRANRLKPNKWMKLPHIDAQRIYMQDNYVFEPISLSSAAERCNTPIEQPTHRALSDSLTLANILPRVLEWK